MFARRFVIFSAVILLLLLSACGSSPGVSEPEFPGAPLISPQLPDYRRITPQEAEELFSDDVIILDVRTLSEFESGHIQNAVLLPYNEIWQRAEAKLPDINQTILVYCQAGRRSEIAARTLIDMGYTNVLDFGGIADWHGEIFNSN